MHHSKLSNIIVLCCSNSTGESWQGHWILHKWVSVVWSSSSKCCVTAATNYTREAIKAQRGKHFDDAGFCYGKAAFLIYLFSYYPKSRNIMTDLWHSDSASMVLCAQTQTKWMDSVYQFLTLRRRPHYLPRESISVCHCCLHSSRCKFKN